MKKNKSLLSSQDLSICIHHFIAAEFTGSVYMYSVVNSVNNDDCRQVSQLNEIPWRAVDNKMWNNKDNRPVISDFKLDIGWYSTVQNARHYVMSSHSAGLAIGSCGTAYPVYLKGKSVCVA